jgi:hypothetical protein
MPAFFEKKKMRCGCSRRGTAAHHSCKTGCYTPRVAKYKTFFKTPTPNFKN